jgi:hypothetical protein
MSLVQRKLVSFAQRTIAIEYEGPRAAAVVDFLYRHIPDQGDTPPHTVYRLVASDESGRLALYRDGALACTEESLGTLAEFLLGDSCYHLAKESRGGLLFHAGAVACQGKGILLPGKMEAGKTTLVAWLTSRGLGYLTDEMVFVGQDTSTIQALTRPLNLKRPARSAMEGYLDFEADDILRSPHSYLIPPERLGRVESKNEPPVKLILFPSYVPASDFAPRPLSKAQAGLALMQCLVNARNLPNHGLSEIARLAQMAPAYRVTYASFEQLEAWIVPLFEQFRVASDG